MFLVGDIMNEILPKSYCCQDGCHNCTKCFEPWNPETWEGYCIVGFTMKSVCALNEEWWKGVRSHKKGKGTQAWLDWHYCRSVEPYGRCDEWERRKNNYR
jgi:hypothetical protein